MDGSKSNRAGASPTVRMSHPFKRTLARRDRKRTQETIRYCPQTFKKASAFQLIYPTFYEPSFQTPNDAAVSAISLAAPAAPPIGYGTT